MPSLSQVRAAAPRSVQSNLKALARTDRGITSASAWLLGVPQALPGRFDLGFGGGAVGPGRALDALPRLQFLVDQEEVLDLHPVELRQVVQVAQVFLARVGGGHAQDLVVAALLVGHPEHAYR